MRGAKAAKPVRDDRTPVVSEWAGLPRYACPFCTYDALDEGQVIEHINERHPLPLPKPMAQMSEGSAPGDQGDTPEQDPPAGGGEQTSKED